MDVLWAARLPLTARAVAAALPRRALAQTTVLTVLSRLEKKGVVRRDRAGRAHTYTAVASREDHIAALMWEVLGSTPDRSAALARFVGSVGPEETAALTEALQAVSGDAPAP